MQMAFCCRANQSSGFPTIRCDAKKIQMINIDDIESQISQLLAETGGGISVSGSTSLTDTTTAVPGGQTPLLGLGRGRAKPRVTGW